MSNKLQTLVDQRNIFVTMTDEDYITESQTQFLIDSYPFFQLTLDILGIPAENLTRPMAIGILNQTIMIYAILSY